MALYIEKRRDEHGNRGTCAVIEGTEDGNSIQVTAPEDLKHWGKVRRDTFIKVSKKAGPARILKGKVDKKIMEMDRLIKQFSIED